MAKKIAEKKPEPVKKKTGDGYPTDIKGEIIVLGSIVCVPITTEVNAGEWKSRLVLGFVKKLTKQAGIDIQYYLSINNQVIARYEKPSEDINVIDINSLKLRDPLHEQIRLDAAMSRP